MRYYDFVPSRRIACDYQKEFFEGGGREEKRRVEGAAGARWAMLEAPLEFIPPLPYFDEEYLEYTELITSVMKARDTFTIIELGARWGTWCQRAYAVIKALRPSLAFHVSYI
jgi:hypothetical protein